MKHGVWVSIQSKVIKIILGLNRSKWSVFMGLNQLIWKRAFSGEKSRAEEEISFAKNRSTYYR